MEAANIQYNNSSPINNGLFLPGVIEETLEPERFFYAGRQRLSGEFSFFQQFNLSASRILSSLTIKGSTILRYYKSTIRLGSKKNLLLNQKT